MRVLRTPDIPGRRREADVPHWARRGVAQCRGLHDIPATVSDRAIYERLMESANLTADQRAARLRELIPQQKKPEESST